MERVCHYFDMSRDIGKRVWLLDLSKLDFQWGRDKKSCIVSLSNGEKLGEQEVDTDSPREAAFEALEYLLRKKGVSYRGESYEMIALYNPFSKEISLNATPDTIIYGDFHELTISDEGASGLLYKDRIELKDRILIPIPPTLDIVERALSLHNN